MVCIKLMADPVSMANLFFSPCQLFFLPFLLPYPKCGEESLWTMQTFVYIVINSLEIENLRKYFATNTLQT